jgi:hypothetical protein
MAKAINWPPAFREEILGEDAETERIALRLGDLYYQNRYWTPDEEVDIRVNHKKIRKAVIVGDLRQCAIRDLEPEDFRRQKRALQNRDAVLGFLAETYHQPVNEDTRVTVVTYRNRPVIPEEVEAADDPHL